MNNEQTVTEWVRAAPPVIRKWMQTPDFIRFLCDQDSKTFQMIGKYDGAMSESCKQLFREEHEAIQELRLAARERTEP